MSGELVPVADEPSGKVRRLEPPRMLRLRSLDELLRLADVLAKSKLVPEAYQGKPADIVVAVGMGSELGLGPFQSLQAIYVIHGRPSLYVEAALAIVRASGLLQSLEVGASTAEKATVRAVRVGQGATEETFTMDDAKRMGLASRNQAYQTQPAWMLQTRAIGRVLHRLFPDVLRGLGLVDPAGQPVEQDDAPVGLEAPPTPPVVGNGGKLAQLTERMAAATRGGEPEVPDPDDPRGDTEPPHPADSPEPEKPSSMERTLALSVVMTLRDKVPAALWATALSKRGLTEAGLGQADIAALKDLEGDLQAVVATTTGGRRR